MKMLHTSAAAAVAMLCLGTTSTVLAQDDGERLPWGALKAGNKDGTIPAYTGGLPDTTSPPGFKKDSGFWVDPFADDKPVVTITVANLAQYADKLSEGTKELVKRFPNSFKVIVYPTRRSVSYPAWVIENTRKNAEGRCKVVEEGLGVEGCFGGIPFPVPKTGYEAMWNLQLHYKGASAWTYGQGWYVDANGNKVMTAEVNNRNSNDYYNKSWTVEQFYQADGPYLLNNNIYTAPARNVGEGNLQRKYVNPVKNPDKTWNYTPGQRRVRLSPDAAYDFPIATSGGASLYDEIYMFSGKMDRFDFKLVGTTEMYIPYNAYRWMNAKPDEVLQKGHPNPDVFRWELHRVRIVEATLKAGQRHVIQKKRFYFDEDAPGAGLMEGWDASGKISRIIYNPLMVAYDKRIPFSSTSWTYEFNTGVYYHSSMGGGYKGLFLETDSVDTSFYTPEGLARRTQR